MSLGGSPSVPQPAKRPEREVEVEAEDIQLGSEDPVEDTKMTGKRSLIKPAGSPASGLNI